MPGSCFSTSTDADSKKQTETESQPDKESDDVPVAEAGVEEVEKLAKEEPRHAHIEMPSITEVSVKFPIRQYRGPTPAVAALLLC